MKNNCVIENNRVFVSDDDKLIERENTETIEEQLDLENEIDVLKEQVDTLENENRLRKRTLILVILFEVFIFFLGVAPLIVSPILFKIAGAGLSLMMMGGGIYCLILGSWIIVKTIEHYGYIKLNLEYLSSELESKKEKLHELEKNATLGTRKSSPIISLREKANKYIEDTKRRMKFIGKLRRLKKQVLKHYKNGTLEEYLKQLGYTEDNIMVASEIASKGFYLKQKKKNS